MRTLSSVWLTLVLVSYAAPGAAQAQRTSPTAVLDTLGLETARAGRVEYRYSPSDGGRAEELALLVEEAAALFEHELGLRFDLSLAALGPKDWFSEFPGVPYAVPWASIDERLILLPSSLSQGVLIQGPDPLADRRRIDFVALHEYGHIAAKEYFRPAAVEPYVPVAWFEEFLATYFAYAYLAAADAKWATAAREEWRSRIRAYTPSVVSLDWSFMSALPGPELSRTYAWYQLVLNQRAAEAHDRYGVRWLPRLRAALSWDAASNWTPDVLLEELDTSTPELAAWARGFGRD